MDVESNEIEELGVAHLGEQRLGAIDDVAGETLFFGDHRVDSLLDCTTTDELMYQDIPRLSNSECSISSLVLNRGIPPAVEVDDVTGGGQVQSGTAGLEREDEERRPVFALKALDEPSPLGDRGPAVKHEAGPPEHALEQLCQRAGDLAELSENECLFLAFAKLLTDLGQALKLAAVLGRVIAGAERAGRDGCRFA